MIGLATIIVVALLILFWAVGACTRLVGLRNQFRNAYSQIDVQHKRRYDLIPHLVETAQGYMKQEREILEAVIVARNQAVAARAAASPTETVALQKMALADSLLNAALGRMFALAEACPELRANGTMAELTDELVTTESRIALARQAYNDGVMQYNTSRKQFPGSIIARVFAFPAVDLMQVAESMEERRTAEVSF